MIFIFSGTGNSYSVALRVSEAMGIGLVDVASSVRYKRYGFDAKGKDVGFIFPTYYGGLPRMVLEFARNVKVSNPGGSSASRHAEGSPEVPARCSARSWGRV